MVKHSLLLLLSLAISSIDAASLPKPSFGPSMSMNLTDLYSITTNTTLPGDDSTTGGVDPRFGVDYQLGGVPLRPIACLMNAVNAMTNLALQDFSGNTPPVVARLSSYPDVVIKSRAPTSSPGLTPIRYILWGIWSFALFAMKHDLFQTMLLTLGFNEVTVGYLTIEKPRLQNLNLAGSNDESSTERLKKRTDVALPVAPSSKTLENLTIASNSINLSLTNISTPSNADDLRVFVSPIGQPLTVHETFMPILACLDYVARFASTSPVDAFRVHPADTDAWIEFRGYGSQPRVEPPFFEYQWVTRALGMLPERMALVGGGRESIIAILVDGVRVGDGWIRKGSL